MKILKAIKDWWYDRKLERLYKKRKKQAKKKDPYIYK